MKKSRLIALTLVVALMLMGTAYAAWTQSINVTTTATTGTLEVDVTARATSTIFESEYTKKVFVYDEIDESALAQTKTEITESVLNEKGEIEESKAASIENGSIVFTGTEFFPNTRMAVHTTFKGVGNVPARVKLAFDDKYDDYSMPTLKRVAGKDIGMYDIDILKVTYENDKAKYENVVRSTGETVKEAVDGLPAFVVEENDEYIVRIFMYFGKDLKEGQLAENSKYGMKIDLEFTQYND
ncbi:hypothetical protein EZV73_23785 [Acidaminobacter sp. JC074]|uniref:hypothetical protein n=1 Tax=Acidaminobacter sp. JC074 TaxID=2530199 RepID=UPI001F0DE23B|nr:hypothetical protein [Acidaminobacter sp. JC074]MCH4890624.1 hypothetical protein [Acidaminobacter sp. JC074]